MRDAGDFDGSSQFHETGVRALKSDCLLNSFPGSCEISAIQKLAGLDGKASGRLGVCLLLQPGLHFPEQCPGFGVIAAGFENFLQATFRTYSVTLFKKPDRYIVVKSGGF